MSVSRSRRVARARSGHGAAQLRSMPAALTLVLVAIVAWLALGAAGLAVPRRLRFISHVLFPASALVALLLAIVALGAHRQRSANGRAAARPAGPSVPRSASTRSRRSSCSCSAPRAQPSRCSRPAISARATGRRRDSSASSITRSSPRWRWSSSPMMRTRSWWHGKRWRSLRSSSSSPSTGCRRSAARASCTC